MAESSVLKKYESSSETAIEATKTTATCTVTTSTGTTTFVCKSGIVNTSSSPSTSVAFVLINAQAGKYQFPIDTTDVGKIPMPIRITDATAMTLFPGDIKEDISPSKRQEMETVFLMLPA